MTPSPLQPNKELSVRESLLREALSLVADEHGKAEAIRIFEEWRRTKIDEPRRVKS